MFPSPTAKPMHDSRYWALLSHLGLASAPLEASSFPILSWQWTTVLLLTSTGGTHLHLVKNTLVSRGLFQVTPTALLSSSAVLYWPVRCGRFLLAYMAEDRKGVKTSWTMSECLQYSMNPGSTSSDLYFRPKIKYNDSALLRRSIFISKKVSLVIS